MIPLNLLRLEKKDSGESLERFQILPFLSEIKNDTNVVSVLKTTVLFSFLLAMWLNLQLSLFSNVFSTNMEDLTLVRFITANLIEASTTTLGLMPAALCSLAVTKNG